MSEQNWEACQNPHPMIAFLRGGGGKATDRKLRLFACACVRRVWHLITDPRSGNAVDVAERFADGRATKAELSEARAAAQDALREAPRDAAREAALCAASAGAKRAASWAAASAVTACAGGEWDAGEALRQQAYREEAALLREIMGNPWRPVAFHPGRRTRAVVSLARAAYEERTLPSGHLDPTRLAVLADALEEVGADDSLVAHLRSLGPHVRGCWAVDAVLGREQPTPRRPKPAEVADPPAPG